jgi:hypothetical protein
MLPGFFIFHGSGLRLSDLTGITRLPVSFQLLCYNRGLLVVLFSIPLSSISPGDHHHVQYHFNQDHRQQE